MEFTISTKSKTELIDITEELEKAVTESGVKEGICYVYTPHATAAIIINENYDPNICTDFLDALDKMVPDGVWRHDNVDGNGAAHIKAAMIGPSESIPVKNGKLQLGTWQSPMLVELDGPRHGRRVIVNMIKK